METDTAWRYTPHPSLRDELAEWREREFNKRLDAADAQLPGYRGWLGRLVERLNPLTPGGRAEIIVIPVPDTRLARLAAGGSPWTGRVDHELVAPGKCHDNTTDWLRAMPGWRAWTGYALNGIEWRSHSCPVSPNLDRMVETTDTRDGYFGIVLSESMFAVVEC